MSHVIIKDKTFQIVLSAVNKLVDMVRPTLGPASNKVIIDKLHYRMVVDDGVQIARDFELNDPAENAALKVVKEAAIKTNDRAGDGTTGSLIMLQAILNEVARKTSFNGRAIELELKRGLEEVKKELIKKAKPIKTKDELIKAALVAFDNKEIAEIIADTYFKIGKEGTITIDKSPTMQTTVETTAGVKIDTGYISPYMVTNPQRMETIIEKPYILLTDYRLTENTDIMPLMEKMVQAKVANLVIIADNVEQNALSTMIINLPHVHNQQTNKNGTFPAIAIPWPTHLENRETFIEDIAMLTGAKTFMMKKGDKLEKAEITNLGRAEKFICKQSESIIIGPKGNKIEIAMAINDLKKAITEEKVENQKKKMERRLATFTNNLAVIKVGASTDNEQKALKYKVEDAINAVKSAYNHGVVCGSGLALARIKTSSPILNEALKYPARQLRENMGLEGEGDFAVDEALNVVTGKQGNFMDIGVIDPVDVLLAGVESAVSIASLLLTSSGMIIEKPPKT